MSARAMIKIVTSVGKVPYDGAKTRKSRVKSVQKPILVRFETHLNEKDTCISKITSIFAV